MNTTRLSTKGRILLPRSIRVSRDWVPGTEFTVEETVEGVLLRPTSRFQEVSLDEVAGSLRSKQKPKTIARIHAAIDAEVMRRYDRGEY